MIIRKSLATDKYSKIDNKVWTNPKLSDGAVRLYGYLASLRNGQNYVDNYLVKALGITQKTLTNRKRELKNEDLILSEQIDKKIYILYIGTSDRPASYVKEYWNKLDQGEI